MQTERVTFLTTPAHKAALESFAMDSGMSTGHLVREATTRFIAEGDRSEEDELKVLIRELNEAVPRMRADIRHTIASMERANVVVEAVLAGEPGA